MTEGHGEVTSSGLSVFTVRRMMEDRVNIWAARKLQERVLREAVVGRRARLRSVLGAALTNPTVQRTRA